MEKVKFPRTLLLTAQSGAGKDFVAATLEEIFLEREIDAHIISTGGLLRDEIALGTPFGEMLADIVNQGEPLHDFIADALVLPKLFPFAGTKSIFIFNGGPRTLEQCVSIKKWRDSGSFQSVQCLEVIAPHELCVERLIERTKEDKRLDLSIDGNPGMIDMEKLQRKMSWYSVIQKEMVRYLVAADMYLSVENGTSKEDLKNKLLLLFPK